VTLAFTATPAARAARFDHVHAWDLLRVCAMLDVAGLHLRGEHLFAGMGLPLFHMLSVALSVNAPHAPDTRAFVRARARRFLLPWLFWSVLFGCVQTISAWQAGRGAWDWVEPRMLLYGPVIALWFLPFTAFAGIAAHAAQRALQGSRWERGMLLLLFCAGLIAAPLVPRLALGWPFEQWLFSVPSLLLGFVIGRSCGELRVRERIGACLTLGCVVFAAATLALWPLAPEGARLALRYLLAFTLLSAALWLPEREYALAARLRPLLLGVYILHPMLYEHLVDAVLWRAGVGRIGWLRVCAGVGVSAGCVWLLRRTPLRRFV
jgi:surface polysaccharide O-acyltransferase-like enzyme